MGDQPGGAASEARGREWQGGEVTLRQLYLTFKAGAWLIVLVAVLCGAAAFAYVSSSGVRYLSTATVTVTPPAVGSSSLGGFDVSVPTTLDLEMYRAIAFDNALVEELAASAKLDAVTLLGRLELVSRTPASQVRGHLTVDHVVTGGASGFTKERATEVANAWASATTDGVAAFLTGPVDVAIDAVETETAARKQEFDATSASWAAFVGVDERRSLNERLDALTHLDGVQRTRLAMLEGAVAAAAARASALELALEDGAQGASATATQLLEDQLAVLVGERAALEAERDHLLSVARRTTDDAAALRSALTELEERAATLQRDLSAASMTFYRVAAAGPTLHLQRDLVARSTVVAVPAVAPLLPEPRGRLVAAVAAAAVGGLLATLFVFLRAAVRDPQG